jgi:hypothetical protein
MDNLSKIKTSIEKIAKKKRSLIEVPEKKEELQPATAQVIIPTIVPP